MFLLVKRINDDAIERHFCYLDISFTQIGVYAGSVSIAYIFSVLKQKLYIHLRRHRDKKNRRENSPLDGFCNAYYFSRLKFLEQFSFRAYIASERWAFLLR